MKVIKYTFIFSVALIFFTTCLEDPITITGCNNSDHAVRFTTSRSSFSEPNLFPGGLSYLVKKRECRVIGDIFKENHDIIRVFTLDADTFRAYSWQELREGNKILQCYVLSWKDIEQLNYTIPYPPTEAMKDMEIYPPYGEDKKD